MVARLMDGNVLIDWHAQPPGAARYVGRVLEEWLRTAWIGDREDEASFLYVAINRRPLPDDSPTFGKDSPLSHLGFGQSPSAPEEWETGRVQDIARKAVAALSADEV